MKPSLSSAGCPELCAASSRPHVTHRQALVLLILRFVRGFRPARKLSKPRPYTVSRSHALTSRSCSNGPADKECVEKPRSATERRRSDGVRTAGGDETSS
eukprot:scaffold246_cov242-Pinguiococcus_pyrenoidosus.AAC.19